MVSRLDFISIRSTLHITARVRNGECGSTVHTKRPGKPAWWFSTYSLSLNIVRLSCKTQTGHFWKTQTNHHHQFAFELGLAKLFFTKEQPHKGRLWWEGVVTESWYPGSECHQVDHELSGKGAGG